MFFYRLTILAFILVCSFSAQAQYIDTRFTNPVCNHYGNKPKNSFCTREDLLNAQNNPEGPYQKVIELIQNQENKKITLGSMTFSNKGVATELCKALKRGVSVDILLDIGSEMATANQVVACGAKLFEIGTDEGEEKRGDLHHNKFLLVDQGAKVTLVFATANFSNPGMTINHETWTFVSERKDSKFIKDHLCLIRSLKKYTDDLKKFRSDLNACRNNSIIFEKEATIESLFVPADSTQLLRLIEEKIKSSSRVLLVSNRYSYDRITSLLNKANRAERRAIFDDDLYWGGIQPTDDYINEALDAKKIVSLEKVGVKVKFTQTSFGAAQKMHNKFIVFDDLVIVGAGNYTYAGMTSNFENFYVIKSAEVVEKFHEQFENLWKISTYRDQMPTDYWDPGVRP